jgi:hypothetical protein
MSSPDASTGSFFAPVPESVPPEEIDELASVRNPVWSCPPQDVRPGVVALSVELGRSESTAVLLEGARAYDEGVVLRIVVVIREATPLAARRRVFEQLDITHGRGSLHLSLPAGGLRWGFEFSDGQRVTTLNDSPWVEMPGGVDPAKWDPGHPVLEVLSRPAIFAQSWSRDVWLWPLPPAGPLRVVCAWPDREVRETSTTFDATQLRIAAAQATLLWQ